MNAFKLPRSYYTGLSAEQLIKKLLMDGVIDEQKLRNKLIAEDYMNHLKRNRGYHYLTVLEISEKYNLSERRVQDIFYKRKKRKSRVKI